MVKNTSVNNNAINQSVGVDDKARAIVVSIFKNAPNGLTNREMIRDYDLYVNTLPANTAEEKTEISAVHQSLKGARSRLTHKGILPVVAERTCAVSNRVVEVYKYNDIELSVKEQILAEIKRREADLARVTKKITELRAEIDVITVLEAQGDGQN